VIVEKTSLQGNGMIVKKIVKDMNFREETLKVKNG
jgi:hypothetical protein